MPYRTRKDLPMKIDGAVTEVSYEDHFSSVPFLRDLCASVLASEYMLVSVYCKHLPRTIKYILLSRAISDERHISLLLLLKNWPDEIFTLQYPAVFRTWKLFYLSRNVDVFEKFLMHLYACIWLVVRFFLDCIKMESESEITYIDLSEIQTMDAAVKCICSFICCNDINASFSPSVMFESNSKKDELTGSRTHSVADRLQRKYTVKFNCTVSTRETAHLLYSALEADKAGTSCIHLVVTGLQISLETPFKMILPLLRILNPQDFESYCSEFYRYSVSEFRQLVKGLKKFHNMKVLDLSYTGLDSHRQAIVLAYLSELLQAFPHLNRLDISNFRISGALKNVLGNLYYSEKNDAEKINETQCKKQKTSFCVHSDCFSNHGKLTYLGLAGCRLLPNDITYLTESSHAKTLKYLNLSDNNLEVSSLIQLLEAAKENLRVLEVESCHLDIVYFDPLFVTFSTMKKLKFLNIAGIQMNPEHLLSKIPHISKMTELQCFRFSFINYHGVIDEHQNAREAFVNKFKTTLEEMCNNRSRSLKIMCQ